MIRLLKNILSSYIMSGKRNKQRGGEIHHNAINKTGRAISFPNGFPNLQTNGDYHIIHAHDPILSNVKANKLAQLHEWLTETFLYPYNSNPHSNETVDCAYRIATSKNAADFKILIDWLNDPRNN
jgi:hypothetical protein